MRVIRPSQLPSTNKRCVIIGFGMRRSASLSVSLDQLALGAPSSPHVARNMKRCNSSAAIHSLAAASCPSDGDHIIIRLRSTTTESAKGVNEAPPPAPRLMPIAHVCQPTVIELPPPALSLEDAVEHSSPAKVRKIRRSELDLPQSPERLPPALRSSEMPIAEGHSLLYSHRLSTGSLAATSMLQGLVHPFS